MQKYNYFFILQLPFPLFEYKGIKKQQIITIKTVKKMKRVLSHAKRLFKNHVSLWLLCFCVINVFTVVVFMIATGISMLYFEDPVEDE